jgi:hypothetical protein
VIRGLAPAFTVLVLALAGCGPTDATTAELDWTCPRICPVDDDGTCAHPGGLVLSAEDAGAPDAGSAAAHAIARESATKEGTSR